MKTSETHAWTTTREIADHFSVATKTVRCWAREGLVPHVKVGKRGYRFRIEDVETALLKAAARGRGRWGQ